MKILYSKRFKKLYKKSNKKVQQSFDEKVLLFLKNPTHPLLNTHGLHGKYNNAYSINVTGDIRALYERIDKETVEFFILGSHSELYS